MSVAPAPGTLRASGGADTRTKKTGDKKWSPNRYACAIGFAVAKASVIKERGARMSKSDFVALSGWVVTRLCLRRVGAPLMSVAPQMSLT